MLSSKASVPAGPLGNPTSAIRTLNGDAEYDDKGQPASRLATKPSSLNPAPTETNTRLPPMRELLFPTPDTSGAWTPQDDQQLLAARAQGLNWSQIKGNCFPTKTANACRKRYERLAERRFKRPDVDDRNNLKFERLAQEYMAMRKEIWSGLAARTGEKWNVVEEKCMTNGLKSLQSASRAASRYDRQRNQGAETTAASSGEYDGRSKFIHEYDDDSGVALSSTYDLETRAFSPTADPAVSEFPPHPYESDYSIDKRTVMAKPEDEPPSTSPPHTVYGSNPDFRMYTSRYVDKEDVITPKSGNEGKVHSQQQTASGAEKLDIPIKQSDSPTVKDKVEGSWTGYNNDPELASASAIEDHTDAQPGEIQLEEIAEVCESDSSASSSEEEGGALLSREGQKKHLLNRLMRYFYQVFSSCPVQTPSSSARNSNSGREASQPQNTVSTRSSSASTGSSSLNSRDIGRGRKRSADDENGDDSAEPAPKRVRGNDVSDGPNERAKRLACPYFKMNPTRYQTERSCPGPGWTTVHRIKEHLYRCHARPISCPRCCATFDSDQGKDEHIAAEVRCDAVLGTASREGFDSAQRALLRSRKKSQKQMTEVEKWYDVYMILFPDVDPTDLPSPYYEYASTGNDQGSPSSELSRYEQFLRMELPSRVRQRLEVRIEEALDPFEEHLRAQLVDIVRDLQIELFDLYRSSRTDTPPQAERDESRGDPDASTTLHAGGEPEPQRRISQALALAPLPVRAPDWNMPLGNQLEAFRPEPPYPDGYFEDFDGLLFDFQPSFLARSDSLGDSGYVSLSLFPEYLQHKSHGQQPENGPGNQQQQQESGL